MSILDRDANDRAKTQKGGSFGGSCFSGGLSGIAASGVFGRFWFGTAVVPEHQYIACAAPGCSDERAGDSSVSDKPDCRGVDPVVYGARRPGEDQSPGVAWSIGISSGKLRSGRTWQLPPVCQCQL